MNSSLPNPQAELDKLLTKQHKWEAELSEEADADTRQSIQDMLTALQKRIALLQVQITGDVVDGDKVAGDKIGEQHNYFGGKRPANRAVLLHDYLNGLAEQLSELSSLPALDKNRASPTAHARHVRLTNVYTTLNTTEHIKRQVPKQRAKPLEAEAAEAELQFDERNEPLRALEAVRDRRCGVLLGEPGSGKSTFAQYLVLCLSHLLETGQADAQWLQGFLGDWGEADRDLLPVWVTLREYAATLDKLPKRATANHLYQFVATQLEVQKLDEALGELIEPALKAGKAFVLLDGLDEVIFADRREFICAAIQALARRYPKNRFLVTCRTRSYLPASEDDSAVYPHLPETDFPVTRLADFDDKQIEQFIQAWHAELVQQKHDLGEAEINRRRDKLLGEIPRRTHLRELAGNPLLLTLMAWIHTFTNELPEKRAAFYESATQFLLWEWDQQKHGADTPLSSLAREPGLVDGPKKIERALWLAAFAAQEQTAPQKAKGKNGDEIVPDVDESVLTDALSLLKQTEFKKPDRNWADRVVDAIKHRSGLLKPRLSKTLTFPHRTFQEYFAAKHLMAQRDPAALALEKCQQQFDVWNEVIPLAVGVDAHVNDSNLSQTVAIVRKLMAGSASNTLSWRKAWLCGKALDDIDVTRIHAADAALQQQVVKRLEKLVTTSKLAPVERAAAATSLAHLGDPRFGAAAQCYLPKDAWAGFIHIPAGPFCMGTRENEFYTVMEKLSISREDADKYYRDEIWPNTAPDPELPDYYMARYPVTVAQFRSFVEQAKYDQAHPRPMQGVSNAPVTYVNWHDAIAYCNWLTTQLRSLPVGRSFDKAFPQGWRVGLPSEAEFEKAARGPLNKDNKNPRRLFAWGDDNANLSDFANTFMSQINRVSSVGCYSKGRSPFGCEDLIGNVWEWTRSLWGTDSGKPDFVYPYDPNDPSRENLSAGNDVYRVVRGGSWRYAHRFARCAFRNWGVARGSRSIDVGFRIVVSPVSS